MSRDENRRQERRKRENVRRQLNTEDWWRESSPIVQHRAIARRSATPRLCSCVMCGNPRRYFDTPTLDEVRADINEREMREEET